MREGFTIFNPPCLDSICFKDFSIINFNKRAFYKALGAFLLMEQREDEERWKEILSAFNSILEIPRENWRLEKVKYLGRGNKVRDGKNKKHKFIGILTSKCGLEGEIRPSESEMNSLRNYALRHMQEKGGADFIRKVKWKEWDKEVGKYDINKFTFYCFIEPNAIRNFRIANGICRIEADTTGIRY